MAPLAALARRAAFAATALALSAAAGAATAAGLLLLFLLSPRAFLRRTDWAALELPPATAAPLSHEFVETEAGVVIHIARTGSGDGTKKKPLMLLLHGFPEHWRSWHRQIDAFRGAWDVAALDLRGYGESSKPRGKEAYAVGRLAADVAAVARTLGGGAPVALVGHDWGGVVAWHVAHLYPALVARLVVACAPHPRRFKANMDGDQLLRSWYVFLFQLPALPELLLRCRDYAAIDAMLAQAGAGAGRGTGGAGGAAAAAPARGEAPLAAAYYKRELARPGALTAAIDYYRASFGAPSPAVRAALARRVAAPTLLVWAGADSALGPQLLRGVGAHVADLRVEVVPGASHWVQQSDAGAFNALVADFLAPLLA